MGVRLTSTDYKVALYDSVSEIAFGPVFDNTEDAEAFLHYLENTWNVNDARTLHDDEIMQAFGAFCEAKL